jgi:hypothetical protein
MIFLCTQEDIMARNIRQGTANSSIKRERFIRIVESRVNKILSTLDNLGKCSNKRNYEYSEEDVHRIFREIERKVKETRLQFQDETRNKGKFRLR